MEIERRRYELSLRIMRKVYYTCSSRQIVYRKTIRCRQPKKCKICEFGGEILGNKKLKILRIITPEPRKEVTRETFQMGPRIKNDGVSPFSENVTWQRTTYSVKHTAYCCIQYAAYSIQHTA